MKDFFKNVFATMVGLFLFGLIITALGIMSLVGMVASGEASKKINDNSVLILKLNGSMNERTKETLQSKFNGSTELSFEDYLSAIKEATTNDHVKGIYIEAGALSTDLAQMQELREALLNFKKTGKKIVAYGENYTTMGYYLASVADRIYMNPQGSLDWKGLGGELVYVKDLLAKVGVRVVPVKVGKYKSAVEMFTEDKMSDANREQTTRYLQGWWDTIVAAVSQSRHISKDSLNAYADRMVALEGGARTVSYKLVDKLLYNDQVKDEVKQVMGLSKDDDLPLVSASDLNSAKDKSMGDNIAVYYASGDIVDSESPQGLFNPGQQIVGKTVCKDLKELADDDDIKAVVLRINSGGGSAYASEQIWHQVSELRKKKPVVVSMSGAAASGGYYISSAANWIVADPTTITGSIGIFGLLPDQSELLTQKLGLKYDQVKTNKNTIFGSNANFLTPEQLSMMQAHIDRGYTLFKQRVSEGRKLSMAQVEQVAQGHVFLGADALKIGLVDELGGIDKAVAKAAKLAKLKEHRTLSYPEQGSWMDQLTGLSDEPSDLENRIKATFGEYYTTFKLMNEIREKDKLQAALPYILKIR